MGFSISWVAVKGKARDAVLGELGLPPDTAKLVTGFSYTETEPEARFTVLRADSE